jgi:hypothetical protein
VADRVKCKADDIHHAWIEHETPALGEQSIHAFKGNLPLLTDVIEDLVDFNIRERNATDHLHAFLVAKPVNAKVPDNCWSVR